jgi:predicted GTPase
MKKSNSPTRVVIMGAAGRDFHNFNCVYRDDPRFEVVAFTAAQIPGISGRRYPAELAGAGYASGIPIVDEADLIDICRRECVDQVVFAYSDIAHTEVMGAASRAMSTGAECGTAATTTSPS